MHRISGCLPPPTSHYPSPPGDRPRSARPAVDLWRATVSGRRAPPINQGAPSSAPRINHLPRGKQVRTLAWRSLPVFVAGGPLATRVTPRG